MTERAALLRAAAEDRDDDAPRLVLADWLEDHGEAERAEFIRVQCEIARVGESDRPRLERLAAREKELWQAHRAAWCAELPRWARDKVVFRRGLPAGLRCTPTQWLGGRGLTRAAPIEALEIDKDDPAKRGALVASERLGGLSALRARWYRHEARRELAASPHVGGLRWLDLGRGGCSWGSTPGDAVCVGLAANPALAGLRGLRLNYGEIGPGGLAALGASPYLAGLTHLDLETNSLGDAGAAALAAAPGAAGLTRLSLRQCGIGQAGGEALASSPRLAGLTHLDLHSNHTGPGGAEAVAASPHLTGLVFLSLYLNQIGDEGVRALARSRNLTRLRTLEIGSTGLSAEGVRALAASAALPSLERLGLRAAPGVPVTPELEAAAKTLFGLPNLPRLREIRTHVYWVDGFVKRQMEARLAPLHGAALLEGLWW
jgi:uncharacterized protein (TIGR02996 family)